MHDPDYYSIMHCGQQRRFVRHAALSRPLSTEVTDNIHLHCGGIDEHLFGPILADRSVRPLSPLSRYMYTKSGATAYLSLCGKIPGGSF